ncbi:MAG: threonine/serine exporter ThrE family protein [Betaproteobacteria bacterium]
MSEPTTHDTGLVLELMFRLGQAYLACGEQTSEIELLLRRLALAYGMGKTRVVVLPTAIFITVHDQVSERVTLAEGPRQPLRLDQIAELYRLGGQAQQASVTPRQALDCLTDILRAAPRFGALGALLGHTILAVGVAMVLMPTVANIVAAAVLGLVVGLLKAAVRERTLFSVPLPVVAATAVSAAVFYGAERGLPVDPLHALVPPLVTFLPGGMLTLGMVELAYGDMVSGSSRLITGLVTLVLLAFGLAAGAALMGVQPENLLHASAQFVKLPSASWAGVLVFCVGVFLHFSAPRNSLGWILIVALAAFAAQRGAASVFGAEISGFFGMAVAVPASYLIQQRFGGPPSVVTWLPSFWLVVPGSLGLLSVARMLSDRAAGVEGMITVVFVVASVALGTLVGASVYRFLSERFSWVFARLHKLRAHLRGGRAP